MSSAHHDLITSFYEAFTQRDAAAMSACYHEDVHFEDPVFSLDGASAHAMWEMLCERGKDLRIEFEQVKAQAQAGSAHWEAWYSFGPEKRMVHNVVEASFTFKDGLIHTHTDRFDFYRWTRQALGAKGTLLGWTPMVQGAVRKQAASNLARFIKAQG